MNNVIVLLMDSVFCACLGKQRTEISSTPFIDKLISEGTFIPNMYSFGPYTNAATKGLFCSNPTLEDYGYYYGINASEYNHYRFFKENGYETYGFYYPYYLLSNKTTKNIDHSIYTGGFVFQAIWKGNLEYYSTIQKQRNLLNTEYKLVYKFLELLFECWTEYYENLINNPESNVMLAKYLDQIKVKQSLSAIKEQCLAYKNDHKKYTDNLLKLGMKHTLANIDCLDRKKFANQEFLKGMVYKQNKSIIDFIQNKTRVLNLRNNHIDKKIFLYSILECIKTRKMTPLRYLYNIYSCYNSQNKMISNTFKGVWQEMPSAKTQIKAGMNFLSMRNESKKPFYMFFHILDAHERISYFSYDCENIDLISKEFKLAESVAKYCGNKFKGSLIYQMSLRYIDSCIEEMFNYLKEQNLLDNTTVMIMADHGSSYTYFPIRNSVVNNFHKENYNIPLILWQKDNKHMGNFNGLYSSMDAFPTLISMLGLKKPDNFWGVPVWDKSSGRDYIITEYMGPGCPDMLTKTAWLSIRNKKYMLAYKVKLNRPFSRKMICEAYRIDKDPYELNNLKHTIDFSDAEIKSLIDKIENRFNQICVNKDDFIKNLDKLKI